MPENGKLRISMKTRPVVYLYRQTLQLNLPLSAAAAFLAAGYVFLQNPTGYPLIFYVRMFFTLFFLALTTVGYLLSCLLYLRFHGREIVLFLNAGTRFRNCAAAAYLLTLVTALPFLLPAGVFL